MASNTLVRPFLQSLRYPPNISMSVPHPTLSIAVIHVLHAKNLCSPSLDRAGHRFVGVLDVKIVRRSHLRIGRRTLADHDRRVSKPDLRIGDAAIFAKSAKSFHAS